MKVSGLVLAAAACVCLIAGASVASGSGPSADTAAVTKLKTVITLQASYGNGSRPGGRVRGTNGGDCRGPRPVKIFDVTGGNGNHKRVDLITAGASGSYYLKAKLKSGRKYQAVAPKLKLSKKELCKRALSKTLKLK